MSQLSAGQIKKYLKQLKQRQEQYVYYLGQLAYQAAEQGSLEDPGMMDAYSTLKDVREQIAQWEAQLEQIKAAKAAAQRPSCPQCGSAVVKGAVFCPACGASLALTAMPSAAPVPPVAASATAAAPAPAEAVQVPTMPEAGKCPNCGVSLDVGAVFCGNCGFRLATESPPLPLQDVAPPSLPVENMLETPAEEVEIPPSPPEDNTMYKEPEIEAASEEEESAEPEAGIKAEEEKKQASTAEEQESSEEKGQEENAAEGQAKSGEDEPVESTLSCPGCGARISDPSANFCPDCGTKVKE
ncbi:MAG: zinc ribbon domain-containing protein [Actinomycetota bacterium]|nr:zinc ribbon domain-containing protein [Actinomycetota bacterium]